MGTRRATVDDLDVVVATLVESHRDYVWETWAIPGPDRAEKLDRVYRLDLELIALPAGEVWLHDDGAAVAVWHASEPSTVDASTTARLAAVARDVFGDRHAIVREVEGFIGAHRPRGPHWYLGTMGTWSSRRREGCGTAVLRPVLDHLDAIGASAYLETSLAENVTFYEQLGFEIAVQLQQLPYDAPDTWCMERLPD
jgi:GNAT superfamily N-acetyltransferase